MDTDCVYTVSSGSATGNGTLRYRLTSSYYTSVSETSCAASPCSVSLTAYAEELLTLSSSCFGPVVSAVSPTSDSWYDYGTALTVICNGVWDRSGGTGLRATSWDWDGGTANQVATTGLFSSPQNMISHHTLYVTSTTQYQLTLDQGATNALASVTSPTIAGDKYWYDSGTAITYQGYGVFGRADGFGNRSASWYLDSGSPSTLSTTSAFTVTATMTSPHTVHVTIKPQWQVTLDSTSTEFLKSISSPTVSNDRYWYDAGTTVILVLNGTGSRAGGVGSRLVSYSLNGGGNIPVYTTGTVTVLAVPITGMEAVTSSSVTQYRLTLDSGASDALAFVTSPSIPGDTYWYDSGVQVTYSGNGVFARASGTGSRVSDWWWDATALTPVLTTGTFSTAITMSAPHTLHTETVTQYQVTLAGTFSVSSATSPTISGDDYWYDSGTVVSLSLQGEFGRASGTGWRMVSYSVNTGPSIGTTGGQAITVFSALTLTSPQTIQVQAVRQYQVTFDQAIAGALNSITAPTVAGDNYWYDSGSPVTLTVHGVWGRASGEGYRLSSFSINGAGAVSVNSSGTVIILNLMAISAPQVINSNATTQYLLTVIGGSGSSYSVPPPIAGDTGWYDSGTTLRVSTTGTYDSSGGVRQRITAWSIDSGPVNPVGTSVAVATSAIVMDGPHTVYFASAPQFLVTVVVKDNSGAYVLTPDSVLLSVNGGTVAATSGSLWVDSSSEVSVATIIWHGVNVTPPQSPQYGVSFPLTITVNARVYDVTIMVEDPLGLAVGGADASITLANGTSLHASSGGDGTIPLHLIPGGTFQVTVSTLGFSSMLSGNAAVQSTVVVHLPLSWPTILVLVTVVVLVVVGTALALRRRTRHVSNGRG
jgi:hypothetical protein